MNQSQEYLGVIQLFAGRNIPTGWALCDGRVLPINTNEALYSIIGTNYGGNGRDTFALPKLQGGIIPVGPDPNRNSNSQLGIYLGQSYGENQHMLYSAEMPVHNHQYGGIDESGGVVVPDNQSFITNPEVTDTGAPVMAFSPQTSHTYLNQQTVGEAGAGQAHENRMPYIELNYIICVIGVYPPRNYK
ncbi:MAG: phage tail protein [Bacteroidetes bacterium]|nr:MAG: phage tail protein [Bacteroidota bacterium]